MQGKSYALSPLAEIDLEDIWLYTVRNWSLAQADSYHRDLIATLNGLASGTKRGRDVDVRPNYLKCPVGSHMVYFRDRNDQIEVIRVLHQRQDANLNL